MASECHCCPVLPHLNYPSDCLVENCQMLSSPVPLSYSFFIYWREKHRNKTLMRYKFHLCSGSRGQRYHILKTSFRPPTCSKWYVYPKVISSAKKSYLLKFWGFLITVFLRKVDTLALYDAVMESMRKLCNHKLRLYMWPLAHMSFNCSPFPY